MTVFKNYFKITKAHAFSLLVYTAIFLILIIAFSTSGSNVSSGYSSAKISIYVDNASDSLVSKGLESYLKKEHNFKEFDKDNAEDDLFYGIVQAIIRIPENFEKGLKVEIKNAPDSMYGKVIEQAINNYVNKYNAYKVSGIKDEEKIVNLVKEDLDKKAKVGISDKIDSEAGFSSKHYFNFLNYMLLSQIILVVSNVMLTYNKEVVSKRNSVSPVTKLSQNLQLILGHLTIALIIWAIYMGVFGIFWRSGLGLKSTKWMMVNSLVFTITVVTMAVFISKLIKNENAVSGVMNIVALGSSFLAGAFVPQEVLSETTVNISKVLPSYYYITNNNLLAEKPSFETMLPYTLVLMGFALVFIFLTILLEKRKK